MLVLFGQILRAKQASLRCTLKLKRNPLLFAPALIAHLRFQELPDGASIRGGVGSRLRTGGVAEGVRLDLAMTSALNPITSAVIKDCLPKGQRRPFPHNTMSLMTITGAKGSMVSATPRALRTHNDPNAFLLIRLAVLQPFFVLKGSAAADVYY